MMDNMMRNCFTLVRQAAPRWTMALLLAVAGFMVAAAPVIAWAGQNMVGNEDNTPPDGRLEGYGTTVVPDSGSALTYLLFVFLLLVTAGVTFMSSKRTHLD
jgi:hypothetical protein